MISGRPGLYNCDTAPADSFVYSLKGLFAMRFASRNIAFILMIALALTATGCASNNKGKIEGKWQLTSFPGMEEFEKVSQATGLIMYFEFEPNGVFALGFECENKAILDAIKAKAGATRFTAKYKLLSGDGVELYDFSPGPLTDAFKGQKRARSNIKITGDTMTMTDPDGKSGSLKRMK
jgi:hypothetical protein